jgi:2'-deoxynucleoside 5'-phosphate N-hydrolase
MNIYFACSITGGRAYEAVYQSITRALLESGVEVPTAHLAETGVVDEEKVIAPGTVYERDVTWMRLADALIAEVSVPSHGVGYEIGYELALGKPVLCLHEQGRAVSKMITGNPHPNLKVRTYQTSTQAADLAREFVSKLQQTL